jgi:predicted patatin/cPLA2 family phospholipase
VPHFRTVANAAARLIASITLVGALAWPVLHVPLVGADAAYAQTKKGPPKGKQLPKDQPRTPFTLEEQNAAVIPGIPDARVWGDSEADFQRVLPTVSGPWLVLSGGGADGAYGAGLLTGWSQSGNRPEFALVTGSSIGSLIGPYAFLGTRFDDDLRKNFAEITAADVFEDKQTQESLFDSWPLKQTIEKRVTKEMLAAIAAEHKKGRRFLVATTNQDAGRRVLWNMGAIAAQGDDKALKLFRDVLLASSSIPGMFQPVMIEVEANGKKFQEMHLDGTVTAPFFVMPESMLAGGSAAQLPTNQIYVIINSKLESEFSAPERRISLILGRTIGVALVAALKAELLLVNASAQRLGLNLNVAHVPEAFSQPSRGLFDHVYMDALFKYGVEQAQKGTAFASSTATGLERRSETSGR